MTGGNCQPNFPKNPDQTQSNGSLEHCLPPKFYLLLSNNKKLQFFNTSKCAVPPEPQKKSNSIANILRGCLSLSRSINHTIILLEVLSITLTSLHG